MDQLMFSERLISNAQLLYSPKQTRQDPDPQDTPEQRCTDVDDSVRDLVRHWGCSVRSLRDTVRKDEAETKH
jgi:hypothetical protein